METLHIKVILAKLWARNVDLKSTKGKELLYQYVDSSYTPKQMN